MRSLITRLSMRRDWLQFGLVPMTMASGDTLVGNWGWVDCSHLLDTSERPPPMVKADPEQHMSDGPVLFGRRS